ncbi:MAG: hypothetical protein QOE33_3555 [Acidobacteriota bacterium]|nr:hypothetical protein [Acidobacteriota bacterium]
MRQAVVGTFIILVLLVSVLCAASFAQESKQEQHLPDRLKGLQLSAELVGGEKSFHKSDTFWIKVKLKNVGKSPITLYKNMGWGWSSSFVLGISDAQGKEIISSFLDDTLTYPRFPRGDFITIKPDETVERKRDVSLKEYEIKKYGTYYVIVWYQSPIPQKFAPKGLKVWATEEGRLESKPVKFEIVK